ncbi:sensor histidine kinase [Actinacidiphila acidipaludis]|uniref:histidine kinase n=1 Tax=Actinacidiphila acidipaludis TaxID=2873382 RepID=A0ABS7Q9V7_9ACTN|nr:histidine kinase [Streptomyces acidipaludis]MBY8879950.1 sensor histidine kinase [Streptomyces acidipaludis]
MTAATDAAPRAVRQWMADRPRLTDVALGGGVTLLDVTTVLDRSPAPGAWGVVLWGTQTVPLLWRRTRPCAVLAAMTALYAVFQALSPIPGRIPGPFLLMIGVYGVARYATASAGLPATVLCLASTSCADALTGHWQSPRPGSLEPISTTTFVFFFTLAWILGYGRRRIDADAARLRDLNRRLRAEQERNARQAVLTERARIARDLHDVVAHHVSAIALLARAAEEGTPDGVPCAGQAAAVAEARKSVGLIARTADTALVEMRRLLGLLSFREQELAPEPSLSPDHLEPLIGAATAAGCRVTYVSDLGAGTGVSTGLLVSGYRIVQEALTNAVKHAGPVGVRVFVRGDGTHLTIEVENDPAPPGHRAVPGSGRGLVGMRERVAAFDGILRTGPREDGGWRVRAVMFARASRPAEESQKP